jgi:DNA-binding CsgD family transcriptional regulator
VQVVQLVSGLACLTGRLGSYDLGQQILLWGIQAARRLHDSHSVAYFLNRFFALLWSRGQYVQGQQAWIECQEIAQKLGQPASLWEPLGNLVYIADVLGSLGAYNEVQRFTAQILDSEMHDATSRAAVLFIRAFYARFAFELDKAYDDLNACLTSLAMLKISPAPSSYQHYFEAEVQTELARLGGDDSSSHMLTMKTISLARTVCDPYTIAELLVDQAMFAHYRGTLSHEIPLLLQLNTLSKYVEAPHIRRCCTYFNDQLSEAARTQLTTLMNHSSIPENGPRLLSFPAQQALPLYSEPLSPRELEIVRLTAVGYSNREIAERLIITILTVKKHLEHIYNKLDVHNRTQMVAVARALQLLQ